MKVFFSGGENPYDHLALEECLLEEYSGGDSLLLLYKNRASVVVGSFQNTHREVLQTFLEQKGIALARRISGGGAVYHDGGNLCWSLIGPLAEASTLELKNHLAPLAQALNSMGIPAAANGRNDLTLFGKKISGSAARILRDKLLFHGTLLYSADLSALRGALCTEPWVASAKGSPSVKSPVVNIRDAMGLSEDIDGFAREFAVALAGDAYEPFEPSPAVLAAAERLCAQKYQSREWIYGRNPPCEMALPVYARGKRLVLSLCLEHERVTSASFDAPDFGGAEEALLGLFFDRAAVFEALGRRGIVLETEEE
ncbi:MAG: biotin/lipoate A/B protein ligase family protein [Bacillota bacterium]